MAAITRGNGYERREWGIFLLRIGGLLLLVLTGFLIGNYAANAASETTKLWEQSARMALRLADRLHYTARPIPSLLQELLSTESFPALRFLRQATDAPPEQFREVWRETIDRRLRWLPETEREPLRAFADPLGTTDLAGQTEHCRLYAKRFEEQRAAAAAAAAEKKRLYPALGLLGGVGVALFLL